MMEERRPFPFMSSLRQISHILALSPRTTFLSLEGQWVNSSKDQGKKEKVKLGAGQRSYNRVVILGVGNTV